MKNIARMLFVAFAIILLIAMAAAYKEVRNGNSCDVYQPTAREIVQCQATMTMEAKK